MIRFSLPLASMNVVTPLMLGDIEIYVLTEHDVMIASIGAMTGSYGKFQHHSLYDYPLKIDLYIVAWVSVDDGLS